LELLQDTRVEARSFRGFCDAHHDWVNKGKDDFPPSKILEKEYKHDLRFFAVGLDEEDWRNIGRIAKIMEA
jgi:RNA:NAD 2'-phosphotransferase (TPT1/KptA family)